MDDHQVKATLQALVSYGIAFFNMTQDVKLDKASPDDRRIIETAIKGAIDSLVIDKDSWPYVKGRFLYDIYLDWRESEKTLTEYDLIRPGLTIGMFSDAGAYQEHCVRVGESRGKKQPDTAKSITKVCSECGQEKSVSKFRRNGGSKCNACQCAAFRKRRSEKTETAEVANENQA